MALAEDQLRAFVAEAQRLMAAIGDTEQRNVGPLVQAFRRAQGDPVLASQFYFAIKDDTAPQFARTLRAFRDKTQGLAQLYDPAWNLDYGRPAAATGAEHHRASFQAAYAAGGEVS